MNSDVRFDGFHYQESDIWSVTRSPIQFHRFYFNTYGIRYIHCQTIVVMILVGTKFTILFSFKIYFDLKLNKVKVNIKILIINIEILLKIKIKTKILLKIKI